MTNQRTIPYDYSFHLPLIGSPGATKRAKVEISVEASFTAVSIGYGVVADSDTLTFGPPPNAVAGNVDFTAISLRNLMDSADVAIARRQSFRAVAPSSELVFREGVRIAPQFVNAAVNGLSLAPADAERAFQVTAIAAPDVPFLYALFDEGTGRAFQNDPILSTAGLGGSGGERPFRPFAVPIVLEPRTVLRLEVTEASFFRGELHIALHGYKTLGQPGSPTDPARVRPRRQIYGERTR